MIHTFNYYETLVLNNYITRRIEKEQKRLMKKERAELAIHGHIIHLEEINNMGNIIATSYSSTDNHEEIYRYSIGIKDLQIYKYIQPSGYIISGNVLPDKNSKCRNICKHIIKPGTSIKIL